MEYYWIGWCQEDNHDKVWGMIQLPSENVKHYRGDYLVFWGRRGKKLQTKLYRDMSVYDAEGLYMRKERSGYRRIGRLDRVYPEFEEDLEKTAVWGMLKA